MARTEPAEDGAAAPRQGLDSLALAEAVRLHEENRGFLIEDASAEAAAAASGGDLQGRIVARAGALAVAGEIRAAQGRLRRLFALTAAGGFLFAIAAGAGAGLAVLGGQPAATGPAAPTNFFLAWGSLLGPHLLMLLAWLFALVVLPRQAGTGSLGAGILALARRLSRWTLKQPLELAAARAFATVMASSAAGRWLVSGLSHGLWFGYLAGCLAMAFLLLSTRQLSFAWETTILTPEHYIALTRAIAAAPSSIGFTTPDAQQIALSQSPPIGQPQAAAAQRAWAGLLLGSLIVYGVVPRLVLALVCLGCGRRAIRRYRLDTSRPGFARLQARLMPVARPTGVIDPDTDEPPAPAAPPRPAGTAAAGEGLPPPACVAGAGPVAILAFESERPARGWPPPVAGVHWLDLGRVEDRADRARALARLGAAVHPPRLLVLACSLLTTPDRGVQTFLADLAGAVAVPLALLLSQEQHFRERGPGDPAARRAALAQRIADWRQIGLAAGIAADNIAAIDLDQPRAASRGRLHAWLGSPPGGPLNGPLNGERTP